MPLRPIARHHPEKVRIRLDRLLDGRAGFEVALLAKGIDRAGGNPDLNDLPIERRSASEVCHALSLLARL